MGERIRSKSTRGAISFPAFPLSFLCLSLHCSPFPSPLTSSWSSSSYSSSSSSSSPSSFSPSFSSPSALLSVFSSSCDQGKEKKSQFAISSLILKYYLNYYIYIYCIMKMKRKKENKACLTASASWVASECDKSKFTEYVMATNETIIRNDAPPKERRYLNDQKNQGPWDFFLF